MTPPPHQPTARRSRRAAGFSLLELMLVVVIMGILMSVLIYNLGGASKKARTQATKVKMKMIRSALDVYSAEAGTYPPTDFGLQSLVATKALKAVPLDDWKHPFRYAFPGSSPNPELQPFDLISAGEDGQFNTLDDLVIWNVEAEDTVPAGVNANP
jgi:general secretion pathway protein G